MELATLGDDKALWRLAVEMRGFFDTMTSQACFCLAVTSGFNVFDETKNFVLNLSWHCFLMPFMGTVRV